MASNGLPLANSEPAPACASASPKVHSAREVGLLSGITMGRQLSSAIACAVEEPLQLSMWVAVTLAGVSDAANLSFDANSS